MELPDSRSTPAAEQNHLSGVSAQRRARGVHHPIDPAGGEQPPPPAPGRATHTSLGAAVQGRAPAKKLASTVQRTTNSLDQAEGGVSRQSWLRPKSLTPTTNAARAIFSSIPRIGALSNSSGPCTVKL